MLTELGIVGKLVWNGIWERICSGRVRKLGNDLLERCFGILFW